jgi:[acyl-carrier-protein] S-malonyltransferase
MTGVVRWVALFSGQGAQRVAHLQRVAYALPPDLREAWSAALADAGADPAHLDDATLTRNRVAQPTLCAWQVAAWRVLAVALPPPVRVAGYSVGEIAACCAAGGYSGPRAIELAALRAACMDDATREPSGLAAVLGLSARELAPLCEHSGVAVAIRNGARHFIVGGTEAALAAFEPAALDAGATRAQRLAVAVPAHTHALADAVTCFAALLRVGMTGPLRVPMMSALDARILRTAEDAADALVRQIATPLDWSACMDSVNELQPDAILEVGPGDALSRMCTEAMPDTPARALDDFREPAAAIAWVARQRRIG